MGTSKRILWALLAYVITPHLLQASPCSFSGFTLGAHLGWVQRIDKTNMPYIEWTRASNSAVDSKKKSDGVTYGLYAGYGKNCNGFYWGGEFGIEHDNASKWASNKRDETWYGVLDDGVDVKIKTKYERGIVFGFAPRIGAVIANENLIYVKLDMQISRDKVLSSHEWVNLSGVNEPLIEKKTTAKTQFVFIPGIGYERAFGSLLARVEYGYNFGGKIKTPDLMFRRSGGGYLPNSAATVKYTAHILKFGLAYKF
jgi:hypothetical protein